MNPKTTNRVWFSAAVVAAILLAALFSQVGFVKNLEKKITDVQFRLRGPLADRDTSIVIVGIDDQTFQALNVSPYPRQYYTEIIRNLNEGGAKLIIFDILFTDDYEDPAQDLELAQVAREFGNVIFAGKLVTEIGGGGTINEYVVAPVQPISEPRDTAQASPWGLVNVPGDDDDFVRNYFIGKVLNETPYYSLGVLAAKKLLQLEDKQIFHEGDVLVMGDHRIPKATPLTFPINYAGPQETFKYYSFVNILDDEDFNIGDFDTDVFDMHKLFWNTFQDKIVFVGAAAAELQDIKLVPFKDPNRNEPKMPGVEVHANALNTILSGHYLKTTAPWVEFLSIPFLALVIGLIVWWLKPLKGGFIVLALVFGYCLLSYFSFASANRILPFFAPVLAIAFSYLSNSAYLYATEQREKRRYRQTFQKYVSQSIVQQMLDSGEFPRFGGERKELTVLFSDIRQFTNFSERLSPEEVVTKLSEYLTEMTEIIIANDGTLDKFVGDEIMAIFGAPLPYYNHAEKACKSAFEMIKRLEELRQAHVGQNGGSYFDIGIGINTGDMVVGNLGSEQLFDYTVIGDAVNLGARLEGLNKFYGTRIIISESTLKAAGESIIARELDSVKVKGKDIPIKIFEVIGIDRVSQLEKDLRMDTYQMGLDFYIKQKWYECLREMNKVLREFPSDGPARLYVRRCLDLMENPPEEEWEPVVTFETK